MDGYTIGRLAAAAGVRITTVRFYERAGLLRPDFRTAGNYRGYRARSLDRLKFIRSAQATGLSLRDIGTLLSLAVSPGGPCDELLGLLRARLADVRKRIGELRRVEQALADSLAACCRGGGPDLCDDACRVRGCDPADCRRRRRKLAPAC